LIISNEILSTIESITSAKYNLGLPEDVTNVSKHVGVIIT